MSPKSDTVLSAAQDKHVRLWDLRSPNCAGILRAPGLPTAAYDEQGLVFCLGTESGIIKLYDVRNYSGGPFTTFTVSEERSSAAVFHLIRFSLDGESLLAVVEGRMYLLDAFSGQTLQRVETGAVAAKTEDGGGVVPLEACFSPDGKYIISGCGDRSIRAWSATTGREVVRYEQKHPDVPACLKWSPRKMLFASACQALMFHIPDLGQLIDGH
jgi:COMPASS component SWD2